MSSKIRLDQKIFRYLMGNSKISLTLFNASEDAYFEEIEEFTKAL